MISLIVRNFYHINNQLAELPIKTVPSRGISGFRHLLLKAKLP